MQKQNLRLPNMAEPFLEEKHESLLQAKCNMTPENYGQFVREKGKVFWWKPGNFYVVTDFNLAKEVLTNSDYSADRSSFFISRMPNLDLHLIKDFFGVISKMMVMSDPPEHSDRKKIASMGLSNELIDRYTNLIEKTITDLIAKAVQKGYIEFVADIAEPLPSAILADLFCIDQSERQHFYKWSLNMTQFFGGASQYTNEDGIEVNNSAVQIRDYFAALIEKRKLKPQDDFLSAILPYQDELKLDISEIISQAVMMLVAGQVTTTDQFNNNMHIMLSYPGVFEQLKENPQLIPSAMEEFNRIDPGVSYLFRVVKNDTSLVEEHKFKKGDVIFIANHAANRDPEEFEEPSKCVLDRKKNAHLSFSYGPHYCLGARLARIQMNTCFEKLIKAYPNLRLDSKKPAVRKHYSLAFSGFESLHLLFD